MKGKCLLAVLLWSGIYRILVAPVKLAIYEEPLKEPEKGGS